MEPSKQRWYHGTAWWLFQTVGRVLGSPVCNAERLGGIERSRTLVAYCRPDPIVGIAADSEPLWSLCLATANLGLLQHHR